MGTIIGLIVVLIISIAFNIFFYFNFKNIEKIEEDLDKEEELKINSVTVKEIMTPRTSIYALDKNEVLKDNLDEIVEQGFSRIPVYDESIDNICGILYIKDILKVDINQKVEKYMRKAMYVPETKNIYKLFDEFRNKQNHMAIIIDEYGGTSGIVTIEDILEEYVGEIRDEYDVEVDNIVKIAENIYDILGETTVDEIDEELDIDIPISEEYETISGYVQYMLGKVAVENDQVTDSNFIVKVMSVENKRITKVRLIITLEEGEKEND